MSSALVVTLLGLRFSGTLAIVAIVMIVVGIGLLLGRHRG